LQQIGSAFGAREQNLSNVMGAKQVLFKQQQEAAQRLAELAEFDRVAHRDARLKELNPTKDLDDRMLQLRMQAFTAESLLNTDPELLAMDPNQRARVIASRKAMYGQAIQTLGQIRDARLDAASEAIDKEISAKDRQVSTMRARTEALDAQIKHLTDIGGDIDAIASLRLDSIKEKERWIKANQKAGNIGTKYDLALNALISQYRESVGETPAGSDLDELKRQANLIAKNEPDLMDRITKGDMTDYTSGVLFKQEETPNPRGGMFGWAGDIAFGKRDPVLQSIPVAGPMKIPTNILEARGYGLKQGVKASDTEIQRLLSIAKSFEDAGDKDNAKYYRDLAAQR
jgi:hypothetical protein